MEERRVFRNNRRRDVLLYNLRYDKTADAGLIAAWKREIEEIDKENSRILSSLIKEWKASLQNSNPPRSH